jgi:hypothetical protein
MNALLILSNWLFPIRIQTPSRGGLRTPLAATELERPWNAPLGIVRSVRDTHERRSAMRGTDQQFSGMSGATSAAIAADEQAVSAFQNWQCDADDHVAAERSH